MNRSIDTLVKQAKRAESASPSSSSERKRRRSVSSVKSERLRRNPPPCGGPYQERDSRYRLKISESGVEKSLMFPTLEEAEAVKTELLQRHGDGAPNSRRGL